MGIARSQYEELAVEEEMQYLAASKPARSHRRFVLPSIVAIQTLVILWLLAGRQGSRANTCPKLLYSPALEAVEYKVTQFAIGGDKRFHIPPSDELDRNWDSLYNFGISRITKEQAAQLPNKTQPIPGDETHYIAELEVFHNLHCLNMIRKSLHSDYYTHMAMDKDRNGPHMDHCVDWIRQSLMCAGDTSVIVWQWEEREQKNKFQGDIAHTCRNFEKLQTWGMEHMMTSEYDATVRIEDDIVIPIIQAT